MTKEEYYKAQICAQVYRRTRDENHLLRQKLAGTDPESVEQDRQDREAFALVRGRKNHAGQLPVVQIQTMAKPRRAQAVRREPAQAVRIGFWERVASVAFGLAIAIMPLTWVSV